MANIVFITVCRNDLANLKITINSVKKFLCSFVRFVIIDGNSSDGTAGYLEHIQGSIPNLSFISERDESIYDAMNKGWNLCNEDDYICFLGAGDYPISLPLESQLDEFDAHFGNVMLGETFFKMSPSKFKNKFMGNYLHHQGLLIRKGFVNSPFDTTFKIYADYNFNLSLLNMGVKFNKLDSFVVYADPNGISSVPNLIEMNRVISNKSGLTACIIFYLFNKIKKLYRNHCNIY